jgi:hypothetical protein
VAAHLVLTAGVGRFVSLIDPPEWARGYAASCQQAGVFPVLAGPAGKGRQLLAAPIILYDYPQVAPESTSQFCDGTEMDEMLTLRALTLTDAEKRLVRGSDPRGAALMDDLDHLPAAVMDRLHGTIRSMGALARPAGEPRPADPGPSGWDPRADAAADPDTDCVVVDGQVVARGTTVRLRPGRRRADAQDMFLDGRLAHVEAVLGDLDGGWHVAVSLDDLTDDGYQPHGRFLYFGPDEIEPVGTD